MAARYARVRTVLWRRTLRGLLVRTSDGDTTLIGGSAPLVWDLLEQRPTLSELVTHLAALTGEEEGVIRGDLEAVLDELVSRDVVTTA